jgi:kynurenine formamidase
MARSTSRTGVTARRREHRSQTWIDVSVPLRTDMVRWPGDPPVRIERVLDFELGHGVAVSRLDMGTHTGTHIDAPAHFVPNGASLDAMPFAATVGRARVVAICSRMRASAEARAGEAELTDVRIYTSFQELLRAGHIDGGNVLPAAGTKIIGAVHQRARALEQVGINCLAQPKSDRTASPRRLPRPGNHPPAGPFQIALEPAAHETASAGHDTDSSLRCHRIYAM